ncbi:MAG: hypothetical protein KC589_02235 [Nanoarchaeota archaeon]|nr:hypothetical protein [Nanoarchaeota archaeon]
MVVEGYFVKPKYSVFRNINWGLKKIVRKENEQVYFQIFVPEIMVLGQFVRVGGKYNLDAGGISFHESTSVLKLYNEKLKNGEIEIVKEINFENESLEKIIINAKKYREAIDSVRNESIRNLNV